MTSTRSPLVFPRAAWWLLAFIPADVLVALDLERGVYRPTTWLARFVPAALVLALVAWAELTRTAVALRIRKELSLALPFGLPLLVVSGLALLVDALPPATLPGAMANGLVVPLSGLFAIAAVLLPFVTELTSETWAALRTSPQGARALVEKFALAAALLLVAWLQLTCAHPSAEELAFGLACFGVALTFSLGALRWLQHGLLAVVASLTLAMVLAGAVELHHDWPVAASLVGLAAGALALTSLLTVRRWWNQLPLVEAQPGSTTSAARWLSRVSWPWRAELEPLRVALWLPLVGVAGTVLFAIDRADSSLANAVAMPMFIGCASAALLSPAIVFSEARRAGTLELLLTVQPAKTVFARKVSAAAAFAALSSVALPAAVSSLSTQVSIDSLPWALAMAFLFAVGLVVALHARQATVALFVAAAAAGALGIAQFVLAEGSAAFTHVLLHSGNPFDGLLDARHLAATFVGTTGLLLALAWWQFGDPRGGARKTALGVGLCLAQAVVIAVVGPLLPR